MEVDEGKCNEIIYIKLRVNTFNIIQMRWQRVGQVKERDWRNFKRNLQIKSVISHKYRSRMLIIRKQHIMIYENN